MAGELTIDHGTNRVGRYLRQHRLRIAAAIALVEGLLIVVHAVSWWLAVPVAALVILFYWYAGRTSTSHTLRQATWIAALSQAMVALVPVVFAVAATIAIAVVGILAIVVLVALFAERS